MLRGRMCDGRTPPAYAESRIVVATARSIDTLVARNERARAFARVQNASKAC